MELAAAPAAPETLQPPQPDYEASKPKKEDYTDNKEYRRDYKRWHTFKTRDQEYSAKRQRELDENSCLQSVLDAEPDQPRFKKPRGPAALADGVPCTWDGERGYWVTASGAHHDVAALRKATTAEYFSAMKLPDAEVQEQRRSDCARVAAAVEAQLAPAPPRCSSGFIRRRPPGPCRTAHRPRLPPTSTRLQAPCVVTAPRSQMPCRRRLAGALRTRSSQPPWRPSRAS